jgi:indole-3-glycerol phosphate synthase
MNILDKIVEQKRLEVAARKKETPIAALEKAEGFKREVLSLKKALLNEEGTGIIAEFKRRSPSKGVINGTADVVDVTSGYAKGGAAALSVLTDEQFFGGATDDLRKARINTVPILRKDFMVDEYQLVEARAMGADVILLIAACLSPRDVKRLASAAKALQLEVLLEIHNEDELTHICDDCDVVGVNNRDLKTFTVDINTSLQLAEKIGNRVKISESGISDVKNIELLRAAGFNGFLIGENFMKQADPAIAFASFVNRLKSAVANDDSRSQNL